MHLARTMGRSARLDYATLRLRSLPLERTVLTTIRLQFATRFEACSIVDASDVDVHRLAISMLILPQQLLLSTAHVAKYREHHDDA